MNEPTNTIKAPRAGLIDVVGLFGLGLVTGGAWMLSHAAGLIVPGVVLLAFAVAGARRA